jgi:hypothetical protein
MSRAIAAITVVFVGVTVCFTNDWIYAHYSTLAKETGDFSIEPAGDLFVAAPFALIAILVLVGGFGLLAAGLTTILLALVTSAGYYSAWNGRTSTSALALLITWELGIPGTVIIYGGERLGRRWRRGAKHIATPD